MYFLFYFVFHPLNNQTQDNDTIFFHFTNVFIMY
jgi:hypothetical protein